MGANMDKLSKYTQEIIDKYNQGLSMNEIAKDYDCAPISIGRLLKKNNINIRSLSEAKKKYLLDEHCFDDIDSEEKAYVLGFLYADGYNREDEHKIKITLAIYDRDILEKIRAVLKTNAPIKIKKPAKIKNSNYCGAPTATLQISSVYLSNRLKELGIVQRKTYDLIFPKYIPSTLLKHFVRGYFDGDGCITKGRHEYPKATIASSLSFLKELKKILESEFIKSCLYQNKKTNKNIAFLDINSKESVAIFFNWIYSESKIYSDRKYSRYYSYFHDNIPLTTYIKYTNEELMEKFGYKDNCSDII